MVVVALTKFWADQNVYLAHGTRVRMRYGGKVFLGQIKDGKWAVPDLRKKGALHMEDTPSKAATYLIRTRAGKKTRLNGWVYWEVRIGKQWVKIDELRRQG